MNKTPYYIIGAFFILINVPFVVMQTGTWILNLAGIILWAILLTYIAFDK